MHTTLGSHSLPLHLLGHRDRGSQYCSKRFRALHKTSGIEQSMAGRGNTYDNATMEAFKVKLNQDSSFMDQIDEGIEIADNIYCYYNTKRKHYSLAYKKPNQFEKNLTK